MPDVQTAAPGCMTVLDVRVRAYIQRTIHKRSGAERDKVRINSVYPKQ